MARFGAIRVFNDDQGLCPGAVWQMHPRRQ